MENVCFQNIEIKNYCSPFQKKGADGIYGNAWNLLGFDTD